MRLLVLSGLPVIATALEAALSTSEGRCSRAVCLGDPVGYGHDPIVAEKQVPLARPLGDCDRSSSSPSRESPSGGEHLS